MIRKCNPLDLDGYYDVIHLDQPIVKNCENANLTISDRISIVLRLQEFLCAEVKGNFNLEDFCTEQKHYNRIRENVYTLLTAREPLKLPEWFLEDYDKILQFELFNKERIDNRKLPLISTKYPNTKFSRASKCALWKGDITTLEVDAIVNAANKGMLGCFIPFHKCIDNVIHAAAGPQVRADCNQIMQIQACFEEVGWAKITRAYNLPSKYVLHTVGPDVSKVETLTSVHEQQLAQCYLSCLNLATRIPNLYSIAFNCISTGLFGFPNELAAKIVLETVESWLEENENKLDLIVFNVYTQNDYEIYDKLLE